MFEFLSSMVAPSGIEPPTQGFSVPCSTDWAKEPWRSVRDSDPWSSAWQADVVGHCTNRPNGCGGRIWTNDLWVMSPTSYQTALPRDINNIFKWRRKRDSNPCAALTTSRFSRPVPSTRLGYSSKRWCLRSDLNRHEGLFSQDFKSCASTYSATQASKWWPVGDSNSRPFD